MLKKITLKQTQDLAEEVQDPKTGEVKIVSIKKGVVTEFTIYNPQHLVIETEEVYNNKGRVLKSKCAIKYDGNFKILPYPKHKIDELLSQEDFHHISVIGFKHRKVKLNQRKTKTKTKI